MYQTFYVDADEEVNSIIGKLRRSTSTHNVLVVAQQALILQSSVSLKLIKKEMDSLKKKVMIITQDEQGLAMAKKVGFPTKKTLEEIPPSQGQVDQKNTGIAQENNTIRGGNENNKEELDLNERNRLRNLGESEFISIDESTIKKSVKEEESKDPKNIPNVDDNKSSVSKGGSFLGNKSTENIQDKKIKDDYNIMDGEFDNLFVGNSSELGPVEKSKKIKGNAGRFLWSFSLIIGILVLGIGAYLFFPKAEINIFPKESQKNINLTVKAQKNSQEQNSSTDVLTLKAILVEEEDILSESFEATGQKASSSKKARGEITIYNNFSEASQILVATTRFLSEDGELFRLTKTVTVPGMKTEDGKDVAGEIKAEVIADQPGEDYNVEATTFKIPGFEGSPKYDKFSAKSENKMKGGGESESELKTVSQTDIDNAKKTVLNKIKSQLNQKIKSKTENEYVFLEDYIEYEVIDSASFPELGAIAENFEYQVKVKAKYLTFSISDVDSEVSKYLNDNVVSKQEFPINVIKIEKEYGDMESNFSDNVLSVKLKLIISWEAKIDEEKIKNELLGKNQEEIDSIIRNHPEIQKIDASIVPSFLANQIPKYPSRVDIKKAEK